MTGECPSLLSGCASTRVYVRGAADGWIFLRPYLGFYVRIDSDESIYDTSIIKVVDIQRRNSPYYVAYMLIPKWLQTPYGYGESPKCEFFCLPPHNHMGTPRMVTGTVFLAIHLVTH